MSTLQHEAHGSDVEEEKRRRVVYKNLRMANAETKKNNRRFLMQGHGLGWYKVGYLVTYARRGELWGREMWEMRRIQAF